MYFPEKNEFIKLSKQGSLVPVYREILADTEPPVSAFSKISGKYSFLLESVEGGENVARYSFMGCDPYIVFSSKGKDISISKIPAGKKKYKTEKITCDPLSYLKKLMSDFVPVKISGLPRFHGGAVGYMGYDIVRFVEDIPDKNPDDLGLPDCQFLFTDTLLVFDHVKHKIMVVSNARVEESPSKAYDEAIKKIDAIVEKLKKPAKLKPLELDPETAAAPKITSNMTQKEYETAVSRAQEYIKNGDIIQVVPSQRFKTEINVHPFDIYRVLRTINPSPYMYYFSFDDMKLVGTSPEIMVRLEDRTASIRPIAGTRPRGTTSEEDKRLESELLSDEKERAEHIMLVDLARNDLGRVCDSGSVRVDDLMSVEKYSHVMHIVSNVLGTLEKDKDAFDLFKACFPAGTVSGAPKIRAMQIIDELEKVRRGPYAGAVGYFDFSGDLDTCITIRTIIIKGKDAYMQAGAGIVADSIPKNEYLESINKAKAMLKAVGMVNR